MRFDAPNYGATVADSTPTVCCGAEPSTCRPAWSQNVSSTTARWRSRASTTGWPPCWPATRCRSATAALVRYDLTTGDVVEHGSARSPGGPGEAVFVPSTSGPADESSGWYIGYVYDPVRDGSDLVIIDATDFTAPPVARIKLPQLLRTASTATG
jgi:carotenoid cleavage dioxygenase-like enzyme